MLVNRRKTSAALLLLLGCADVDPQPELPIEPELPMVVLPSAVQALSFQAQSYTLPDAWSGAVVVA
jgi:hypothetical protein